MKKDPIVEEIHKYREEYAKKFNYNPDLILDDLKKKREELKKRGFKFVSLKPRIYKKDEAA